MILAAAAPAVSAFAPVSTNGASSALKAAEIADMSSDAVEEPPTPPPLGPTLNGWTPDAAKDCFGLPGAISPLGFFDPMGLCADRDLVGVKRFREAEIMHGRVAMMATVGSHR